MWLCSYSSLFFTGSTPLGCYQKLIEYYKNGDLSFKYVKTFNMDEYVGESLSGTLDLFSHGLSLGMAQLLVSHSLACPATTWPLSSVKRSYDLLQKLLVHSRHFSTDLLNMKVFFLLCSALNSMPFLSRTLASEIPGSSFRVQTGVHVCPLAHLSAR